MKLKVFGSSVKVSKADMSNGEFDGFYDHESKQIVIDSNLKGHDFIHTLLHEGLHALFHRTGVNQAIPEELIETLCENVPTFILENFDLKLRD